MAETPTGSQLFGRTYCLAVAWFLILLSIGEFAVFRHVYGLEDGRKHTNYYNQESVGIAAGFLIAAPVLVLVLMLVIGERRPLWLFAGIVLVPLGIWSSIELLLKGSLT